MHTGSPIHVRELQSGQSTVVSRLCTVEHLASMALSSYSTTRKGYCTSVCRLLLKARKGDGILCRSCNLEPTNPQTYSSCLVLRKVQSLSSSDIGLSLDSLPATKCQVSRNDGVPLPCSDSGPSDGKPRVPWITVANARRCAWPTPRATSRLPWLR